MDEEAGVDVVVTEDALADVAAWVAKADAGDVCDNKPHHDVRGNAHVHARDNDDPVDVVAGAGARVAVEGVSAGQTRQRNKILNRIKRPVFSGSMQIAAFFSNSWNYLCNSYAIVTSYFPYSAYQAFRLFSCVQ
jgi:hypothetical protein